MNSKEKKQIDIQQKSILNFFTKTPNHDTNKRTHSDMLRGEMDLTKATPLKQKKVEIKDNKNRQDNFGNIQTNDNKFLDKISNDNNKEIYMKDNNNQLVIKDDKISNTNQNSLHKRNKIIIDDENENSQHSLDNYRDNLNDNFGNSCQKINGNSEEKVYMMNIEDDNLMEKSTPAFKQNKVLQNYEKGVNYRNSVNNQEPSDKMEHINKLFGNFKTAEQTKTESKKNKKLAYEAQDDEESNYNESSDLSNFKSRKYKTENKNKAKETTNKKKSSNKIGIYNIGEDDRSEENSIGSKNLFEHPEEGLPEFLREHYIRDKMGRKMEDLDYDPTTLLVPKEYIKNCTPAMQQYWQFKSVNFDKVIFFKLGKFYELFYDDAIVGNKILDLNWMGNDPKKLHVGFPEKVLEEKAFILTQMGLKVAVIEQVETPEELEGRLKNMKGVSKIDKCIKRDLCNVFTKGTFIHESQKSENKDKYKNKFCITLICKKLYKNDLVSEKLKKTKGVFIDNESINDNSFMGYEWSFIIFDVTTVNFFFGRISQDDENFTKIKTLLYNINPQEVIIIKNNLDDYILNFIISLSSKPLITRMKNDYTLLKLLTYIIKYFGQNRDEWNKILLSHITEEKEEMLNALYFTIGYLDNLLLAEQLLKIATFENYQSNMIVSKNLILDYQTVSNLEILETKLDAKNPEVGSLIEYINQAVSPFGMRKMKQWLLNPLANKKEIEERLDFVEDLITNFECVKSFRQTALKFTDFERLVAKIYKFSIQSNNKAVYFEDFSKTRTQEFFKTLSGLKKSLEIFQVFENFKEKFKSNELRKKVCLQNETYLFFDKVTSKHIQQKGAVIDIIQVLKELEDFFKESKNEKGETIILPKEGIQESYDEVVLKIEEIKEKFEKILKEEKNKLKCPVISYTHTKNYKYEMEIPEDIVKSKKLGSNYKLTTTRKGYMRYHTTEIEDLIEELEINQDLLKKENNKFNIYLFKKFYSKHFEISSYIESLAELDCLCALAYISNQGESMIKPKFIDLEENNGVPCLNVINSKHPCISQRIRYFVPNDILIGNNNKTTLVITGPNMGGKSTILRQACVLVIMAQVGCYVPADEFTLTSKDRIFTRIGARDKILEGKSTFYIELEETKNILENATINSLAIIDELGRGTSTQDGMIIAKTILDIVQSDLKCLCLFTTHYHDLIKWCLPKKNIDLYFMNCLVDQTTKDINFQYKFIQGFCPESYGISVAKLAGLPAEVLDAATEVCEFLRNFKNVKI